MHYSERRHVRERLQDLDEQPPATLFREPGSDRFAECLLFVS